LNNFELFSNFENPRQPIIGDLKKDCGVLLKHHWNWQGLSEYYLKRLTLEGRIADSYGGSFHECFLKKEDNCFAVEETYYPLEYGGRYIGSRRTIFSKSFKFEHYEKPAESTAVAALNKVTEFFSTGEINAIRFTNRNINGLIPSINDPKFTNYRAVHDPEGREYKNQCINLYTGRLTDTNYATYHICTWRGGAGKGKNNHNKVQKEGTTKSTEAPKPQFKGVNKSKQWENKNKTPIVKEVAPKKLVTKIQDSKYKPEILNGQIVGYRLPASLEPEHYKLIKQVAPSLIITKNTDKGPILEANSNMVTHYYVTNNRHAIWAWFREFFTKKAVCLAYEAINAKKLESLDHPFENIWSVAASFPRMAPFCKNLYSQNPVLDDGDKVRSEKNFNYLSRKTGDVNVYSSVKAVEDSTTEMKDWRAKWGKGFVHVTVKTERFYSTPGDGLCGFYAAIILVAILNPSWNNYDVLLDVLTSLKDFSLTSDKMVSYSTLLTFYTSSPDVLANASLPITEFVKLLSEDIPLKVPGPYEWLTGDLITIALFLHKERFVMLANYHQLQGDTYKAILAGNEPNDYGYAIVNENNAHWSVIKYSDLKLTDSSKFGHNYLNCAGIHVDVHYYPEVLKAICIESFNSPQYIIGWTFTDRQGIYEQDEFRLQVLEDCIIFETIGNDTCNAYKHPNFIFHDSMTVKKVCFDRQWYSITTILKTGYNYANYRLMRIMPSQDGDIASVITQPIDNFLTIHKLEVGKEIRIGDSYILATETMFKVRYDSVPDYYENDPKILTAPINQVASFMTNLMTELTVKKAVNIYARGLSDANRDNTTDTLSDAYYIAMLLAARKVLEISKMTKNPVVAAASTALSGNGMVERSGFLAAMRVRREAFEARENSRLVYVSDQSFIKNWLRFAGVYARYYVPLIAGFFMGWIYVNYRTTGVWDKNRWLTPDYSATSFVSHGFLVAQTLFAYTIAQISSFAAMNSFSLIGGSVNIIHKVFPTRLKRICPHKLLQGDATKIMPKTLELLANGIKDAKYSLKGPFFEKPIVSFETHEPLLRDVVKDPTNWFKHFPCDKLDDEKTAVIQKGPHFGLLPMAADSCNNNRIFALFRVTQVTPAVNLKILAKYKKFYSLETERLMKKLKETESNRNFDNWFSNQKATVKTAVTKFSTEGIRKVPKHYIVNDNVKTDELLLPECLRCRTIQVPTNLSKYFGSWKYYYQKLIARVDPAMGGSYNWEEQAKYIELLNIAIPDGYHENGDLSANDATFSAELKVETENKRREAFYRFIPEEFLPLHKRGFLHSLDVVSKHYIVLPHFKEVLAYTLHGTRTTGDPGTYVDNTESNLSKQRFVFYFIKEAIEVIIIKTDEGEMIIVRQGNWGIILCGDDYYARISKKLYEAYLKFRDLVFSATRAGVNSLGDWLKPGLGKSDYPEFCSRDAMERLDGSFRWIRKLRRFLTFTPFTLAVQWNKIRPGKSIEQLKEFAFQEGIGILRWGADLPIFEVYARTLIRLGSNTPAEKVVNYYLEKWDKRCIGIVFDHRKTDYEECLNFWEKNYNYPREVIFKIEKALNACTSLFDEINIPELQQWWPLDSDGVAYYDYNDKDHSGITEG
jgi:hypothetical protein